MRATVEELIVLSRAAGADPLLVQAGGGNASVKTPDRRTMVIKASGCRLGDVSETRGHVALDLDALLAIVADPRLEALEGQAQQRESAARLAALAPGTARPSLETGFHGLLGRVVLHTHPVHVNALTCRAGGEALAREVLAGIDHVWVPYAPPGHALALAVARVAAGRTPAVVLLESHGLIVSGDSVDEVLALTAQVDGRGRAASGAVDAARAPSRARVAALLAALGSRDDAGRAFVATLLDDAQVTAAAAALAGGPICPDDVVYCGAAPLVLAGPEVDDPAAAAARVRAHLARASAPKAIVVLGDAGVLAVVPDAAALEPFAAQARAHALIVTRIVAAGGRPRHLPAAAVEFVDGMEGEAYRRRVLAGGGAAC